MNDAARPLAGQVAIISGGLGDIGSAIARVLAERGADIAIGDVRPQADAESHIAHLAESGVRARYDVVDVSDPDAVERWVDLVAGDLGVPSLIIPNAAIVTTGGVREMTPQAWRRELAVDLDGAYFLARSAVLRLLDTATPRQGPSDRLGRIVFVGSWAAHAPHTQILAYSVAKGGLRMLSRTLALELAPRGILVNEVAPGFVNAGLSKQLWDQDPGLKEKRSKAVPVRDLIDARDVALEVAHLCDPANRHMTGSTVLIDGGLSLVAGSATAAGEDE